MAASSLGPRLMAASAQTPKPAAEAAVVARAAVRRRRREKRREGERGRVGDGETEGGSADFGLRIAEWR